MNLRGEEQNDVINVVSFILKDARGDVGRIMFDAYKHISSERDVRRRELMMDFLEKVRLTYVSSDREKPYS